MNISNINFNLYKSFIAVYESKNMTKASERLCITQPTITHNIKELEKQLGIQLFITHQRGVIPTKEADTLHAQVMQAMVHLNNCEGMAKAFNELSAGTLRFGCQSPIAVSILLPFFRDFKAKHPNVVLEFHSIPKKDLVELLVKRDIDFMIDSLPLNRESPFFKTIVLKTTTNTFFTSKTFVAQNNLTGTIKKERLKELPLLLHGRSFNYVRNLLNMLQLDIEPTIETNTTELMFAMVLENMGIGYCIENFIDYHKNDNITKLNVDAELPKTDLAFIYNEDCKSNAMQVFLNELKKFFAKI